MNFKKAKTSEKLVWLAGLLEGKLANQLIQSDIDHCVCGLGVRVNGRGTLAPVSILSGIWRVTAFARKYGVTEKEADSIFTSEFHKLGIAAPKTPYHTMITPPVAADFLRKLAQKYARKGFVPGVPSAKLTDGRA